MDLFHFYCILLRTFVSDFADSFGTPNLNEESHLIYFVYFSQCRSSLQKLTHTIALLVISLQHRKCFRSHAKSAIFNILLSHFSSRSDLQTNT